MRLLAIIPARKGSRGIPDKNIAVVGGKPLISWTVECALASASIERVLVTTDSKEIADIAVEAGADVPFMRPPELARDDTPGIEPILHAVKWIKDNEGPIPRYVVVLQPTSPLRAPEDVEAALDLAVRKDADAVVSVVTAERHPYWMKTLEPDGRMSNFISGKEIPFRRQDLPDVYALNGAIYLAKTEFLFREGGWYSDETYGYIMPVERSLDVDTPWDLDLADMMLSGGS
jgi:N-acylneuraminate cytidylyltransferase/CMP-N,N'-diacetyllegionaminic acid synthase